MFWAFLSVQCVGLGIYKALCYAVCAFFCFVGWPHVFLRDRTGEQEASLR